jgi:hypothetical protein
MQNHEKKSRARSYMLHLCYKVPPKFVKPGFALQLVTKAPPALPQVTLLPRPEVSNCSTSILKEVMSEGPTHFYKNSPHRNFDFTVLLVSFFNVLLVSFLKPEIEKGLDTHDWLILLKK